MEICIRAYSETRRLPGDIKKIVVLLLHNIERKHINIKRIQFLNIICHKFRKLYEKQIISQRHLRDYKPVP